MAEMRIRIMVTALAALFLMASPALAGDAASCINSCGARCYGQPNTSACEQSCNAYCINQSGASHDICGSIVVADGTNESMGWSWNASDRATAEQSAWGICMKTAQSCRPLITFCNDCAAAARAWGRDGTFKGSFGSQRPNLVDAEQAAMAQCQEANPDASCKIVKRICADGGPR
jgi:hypothetical protein